MWRWPGANKRSAVVLSNLVHFFPALGVLFGMLPVLNRLNDDTAYLWFVLLHIPLFALPMWWTASRAPRTRFVAQICVDLFIVIHLALHVALRSHPDNTFHSALSEICIYGAGIVGLVHGLLALRMSQLRQHDPGTHSR